MAAIVGAVHMVSAAYVRASKVIMKAVSSPDICCPIVLIRISAELLNAPLFGHFLAHFA